VTARGCEVHCGFYCERLRSSASTFVPTEAHELLGNGRVFAHGRPMSNTQFPAHRREDSDSHLPFIFRSILDRHLTRSGLRLSCLAAIAAPFDRLSPTGHSSPGAESASTATQLQQAYS
jgi:hypothetical protein